MKSNICDYNNASILVRGNITIIGHQVTQIAFKNCAPFTKSITKTDGTTTDDAEDLVMPMKNLIEYSSNNSETTGSLLLYPSDEANNFNADIANTNKFEYSMCKAKLLENTDADGDNGILNNATIAVPLKNLSNFWRSLEMPLINCKIELKLKWKNYCALFAVVQIMQMINLIKLFSLSKTQNYMFL